MERRVVVTGMGAVSPLGLDVPSLWQGVREARSGVGPVTLCDTTGLESRIAGEVKGFDAQNYMDRKEVRRNDRFIHFAIAATREALQSAELAITPKNAEEIGAIIGSGIGGIETFADGLHTLRDKGPGRVSPFLVPAMITNMAAGQVSIQFGLKRPRPSAAAGPRPLSPAAARHRSRRSGSPHSSAPARSRLTTRTLPPPRARSTRPAMALCSRKAVRCCCWKISSTRRRAA